MLILVVEPGKVPETRDISGNLKEMQSIVGGYIQAIYPFPGIALVCNEEGCVAFPETVACGTKTARSAISFGELSSCAALLRMVKTSLA